MTICHLTEGAYQPTDIADVLSAIVDTTPIYDAIPVPDGVDPAACDSIYVVPVAPADADTLRRHYKLDFTPSHAVVPLGPTFAQHSLYSWDLYLADSDTAARECADVLAD
jgi:hypothetical protein